MFHSKLAVAFVLLLLAVLLSACAATTEVEFEPAELQQPQAVDPEPAETVVEPAEIKAYSTDIAATAEQLYGSDPGSSKNATYKAAAIANPMLRYTVIYFDFNKSQITADAREILSHHADFMRTNPALKLRIEGHADQRGTSGYNLALGELRANAVRTLMAAYGVDGARISVISYGEEQPAIDGTSEEAFKLNRRAELIYP